MGILSNPKHEEFCQQIARGVSQSAAYVAVGYKANRGNACALGRDERIRTRVAEILAEKQEIERKATVKAMEELKVDKAYIIGRLVEVVETSLGHWPMRQMKKGPKPGSKGQQQAAGQSGNGAHSSEGKGSKKVGLPEDSAGYVEVWKFDGASANRALELLGKEHGMFIDRREVRDLTTAANGSSTEKELVKLALANLKANPADTGAQGVLALFPHIVAELAAANEDSSEDSSSEGQGDTSKAQSNNEAA
jgi:hypothetical protein